MSTKHYSDICSWYAIYTNPRQEVRAESNLKAWNIETYLPKIRESGCNDYDDIRKDVIKPLFLRYLFARFSFSTYGHRIRYTRGISDIVGFGEAPVPIDDEIIGLIRSRHDELGYVKLGDEIKTGDEIVVRDGIFKGIHGIFERNVGNSGRVIILQKAILFQAHIVIEKESIKKIENAILSR
jgi:transcriptional antiterminator RfaH